MPSVAEMLDGKTVRRDRKHPQRLEADGSRFVKSFDKKPAAEALVREMNEAAGRLGLSNTYYAFCEIYAVSEVVGRGPKGRLALRSPDVWGVFVREWQTAPEGWRDPALAS